MLQFLKMASSEAYNPSSPQENFTAILCVGMAYSAGGILLLAERAMKRESSKQLFLYVQ